MKKYFLLALVVLTGIASSCKYDDDEVWDSVNDLANRVTALEEATKQLNSDIAALQSIVSALQKQVSVSKVETLADGYIIHFSDGTKATIKNGENGQDGADGEDGKDGKDGLNAPIINVAKEGGVYYWTITVDGETEWLTDELGNKMPVSGEDGKDGSTGATGAPGKDGNTPLLRVNDANGLWEVSYDNGKTYVLVNEEDGGVLAKGENGDSKFANQPIEKKDGYIVITMANGTEYELPLLAAVEYTGQNYSNNTVNLLPGASTSLTYAVPNLGKNYSAEIISHTDNISVSLSESTKKLTVKSNGQTTQAGKIVILYYNANQTITSVLTVNVSVGVSTATDLQIQLNKGGTVSLSKDIAITSTLNMSENSVLDGQGNKISGTLTGYSTPAINTTGGTIKNLSMVTGCQYSIASDKLKADLYLENITTDKTGYGLNLRGNHAAEYALYATNCIFKGWSSLTAVTQANFTNCTFGKGEYWVNKGYPDVFDRLIKPYVNTVFENCDFEKGFYIDMSAFTGTFIKFINCKVGGVALTKEMFKNSTESANQTIEELGDKKLWYESKTENWNKVIVE